MPLRLRLAARPAEDRADPGQQFAWVERLGQIIVGAHFQAEHAVDVVALGGQHQDGHGAGGAQITADGQAVLAGQHQVEDDQIRCEPAHRRTHRLAVPGRLHLESLARKQIADEAGDLLVVLDDQNLRIRD